MVMHFFTLKFACILKRLQKLRTTKAETKAESGLTNKRISNRRLSRLIYQFNYVQGELLEINEFFQHFVGISLLSFFGKGN